MTDDIIFIVAKSVRLLCASVVDADLPRGSRMRGRSTHKRHFLYASLHVQFVRQSELHRPGLILLLLLLL